MKITFYPSSLISRTKGIYSCKIHLGYFGKLVQEQGISFLVGIAVGINLIVLLQMSEDIINKLSEILTGSIIGTAAIMSIIIVGVTIIYIQKKTDQRIKTLIEQQKQNK